MGERIVLGVPRENDRTLLCHRRADRPWYPGLWDLPGGHVEPGEVSPQALARELREELGISIEPPDREPEFRVRPGGPDLAFMIWFVRRWDGDPCNAAPHEHEAIRWVRDDEMATLALAHPSLLELIASVAR